MPAEHPRQTKKKTVRFAGGDSGGLQADAAPSPAAGRSDSPGASAEQRGRLEHFSDGDPDRNGRRASAATHDRRASAATPTNQGQGKGRGNQWAGGSTKRAASRQGRQNRQQWDDDADWRSHGQGSSQRVRSRGKGWGNGRGRGGGQHDPGNWHPVSSSSRNAPGDSSVPSTWQAEPRASADPLSAEVIPTRHGRDGVDDLYDDDGVVNMGACG